MNVRGITSCRGATNALTAPLHVHNKQVGAIVLGVMSDAHGRRPAFLLATLLVVAFGVLTTFAPSFWWLLLFRTLVGVGAGGMEVPFDLLGEIINHKEKSRYDMACTQSVTLYITPPSSSWEKLKFKGKIYPQQKGRQLQEGGTRNISSSAFVKGLVWCWRPAASLRGNPALHVGSGDGDTLRDKPHALKLVRLSIARVASTL